MKHVIVMIGGPARSGKDSLIECSRNALQGMGEPAIRTDHYSSIDPVKAIIQNFQERFGLKPPEKDSREYGEVREALATIKGALDGRGGVNLTVNLALHHLNARRPMILFYQVREIQEMAKLRMACAKRGDIETVSVFVQRCERDEETGAYYTTPMNFGAKTDQYDRADVLSFFDIIVNNTTLSALEQWGKLIASMALPLHHG